ncbi:MAG: TIM barrel protein [Planctomycetes bacterium]|nr:TIM barrel protein [Planctomycetota bacterium]
MYLTGFADEASANIDVQIKANQELGWKWIESRCAGSANIHDIDDAEFEQVYASLQGSGIGINCFGSAIANWATQITDSFDVTLEQIDRAIPRMQRLGTKMVRIMSFAVLKDRALDDQMETERFSRLREIQSRFMDAGIVPVHENCMNYGGMGSEYTLKMIDQVPGLKLVYDTGNPVFSEDRNAGVASGKRQSAWDFYQAIKDHVVYVHIKDGHWNDGEVEYSYPNEGQADVKKIVKDLLDNGYLGGFSMEPHLKKVFHEESGAVDEEGTYSTYVEYGKRFMTLLEEIGHPWSAENENDPSDAIQNALSV